MKPFTALACVIVGLIALGQFARLLLGWEVSVNHVVVPLWPSGVIAAAFAVVAVLAWRERA
jgi:hypothetical protein